MTENVGIAFGDCLEGDGILAGFGGHELIWVLAHITQPFFLDAAGRGNDIVVGLAHSKHLPRTRFGMILLYPEQVFDAIDYDTPVKN